MTRRINIPFLVDLLLVDDPVLMGTLNQHPQIGRRLERSDRWLNEKIRRHIQSHMKVGETPLPVFENRDTPSSREHQEELATRLDALASEGLRAHAEDVRRLSEFVAGGAETEVGVIVQRIVGRMFRSDYAATPESYRAAVTVAAGTKWIPIVTALKSGRLRRAISLVWSQARNDAYCIHGTGLAMHNVVETVQNMRAGFVSGGAARSTAASDAINSYLQVPKTLLRSAAGNAKIGGLSRPLHTGTIVLFQLRKAVGPSGDVDRAFARGEWNECPASRAILELLEQVWEGAARAGRGRTPAVADAS